MIVKEYVSPDGALHLFIDRDESGDLTIGFRNYEWHTHGDILAASREVPIDQAVESFVAEVIDGTALIATSSINDVTVDVWICNDNRYTCKYLAPGESISFRRWNGETVDGIAVDDAI
jgi:hypothetical protein